MFVKKFTLFLSTILLFLGLFSLASHKKSLAANTAPVTIKAFIDTNGNGAKDTDETKCYPFKNSGRNESEGALKYKVGSKDVEVISSVDCSISSTSQRPNPVPSDSDRKTVAINTNYLDSRGFKPTGLTVFDDNGRRVLLNATSVGTTGRATVNFGIKFVGVPDEPNCDRNPTLILDSHKENTASVDYRLKITNNDDDGCTAQTFNVGTSGLPDTWTATLRTDNLSALERIENLAAGRSIFFKIRITPNINAPAGPYTFDAVVKDPKQNNKVVSQSTLRYTIAANCDRNKPLLEVTEPKDGQRSGKSGQERKYTIKVTNKDSDNCGDETFVLTKEFVPNNFNVSFDDATLKIAPKGHESTVLHATPQNDASSGDRTITVGIKRQGKGLLKSLNLKYVVQPGTDDRATKAPTKKPTDQPATKAPTKKPTDRLTQSPTRKPTEKPGKCTRVTPQFSVTPDSQDGAPGKAVKYIMVIKNIDEGPCDARKLSFEAKTPAEAWAVWKVVFAKEKIELEKGGAATIDVVITAPSGAAPGDNKITLNLKNVNGAVIATSDVSYVVAGVGNGLLNIRIGVDGIGTTPRIPIGGNKNPQNENRNITLSLFDTVTNTLTKSWVDWTFTYSALTEKFESQMGLSDPIPTGTYNVYAEGGGFIRSRLPGSATINVDQTTNIYSDNFYLIAGNINNTDLSENRIDIMDYGVLISCWIYSSDFSLCDEDPNYAIYADLNDDGITNEDDYTLFLKEFGNEGAILPEEQPTPQEPENNN
ncbi:MAG: hypothetical protein HY426_00450 [Candidatus Levybacteria bacterium]|nr:hypothetical protein [Candidatus Levybacteria bacterium]